MTYYGHPLDHVVSIPPYPPGRPIDAVAREFGLDPADVVKIASNENPLGASPAATAALEAHSVDANIYPDFDCYGLRHAIAAANGTTPDRVLPGAGSSELLLLVARAFLDAGRAALIPEYSFVSYEGAVRSVGAEARIVPVTDWRPDLDALLAAVDHQVHLVYLASPNNPTGTVIPAAEIERFAAALPPHVLLVLDEAYREFLAPEERPDIDRLFALRDNLIVTRTFSKIHGLAGLRVGYALGSPELLGLLRRLQLPFSVNAAAQAAAIAALGDAEFAENSRIANASERARVAAELDTRGIEHLPSGGNFIMLKVGDGAAVTQQLMRRGVIIRGVANYGLKEWVRASIGLPRENDLFLQNLDAVLAEAALPA
jgi:histidinol-phosphate aminotransferase